MFCGKCSFIVIRTGDKQFLMIYNFIKSQEFNPLVLLFNFLRSFKLFVFEFLIRNSYFTGQLSLNDFTYYFEDFLRILTNLVNCQLMPKPKYYHMYICNYLGIPKSGNVKQKEELKTMLKWGEFF